MRSIATEKQAYKAFIHSVLLSLFPVSWHFLENKSIRCITWWSTTNPNPFPGPNLSVCINSELRQLYHLHGSQCDPLGSQWPIAAAGAYPSPKEIFSSQKSPVGCRKAHSGITLWGFGLDWAVSPILQPGQAKTRQNHCWWKYQCFLLRVGEMTCQWGREWLLIILPLSKKFSQFLIS